MLLMVSTVRYRTFKDLRLSKRSLVVFMFVIAGGVVIGTQFHPAWVLVALFSAYLVLGLLESLVLLRRYVVEKRAAAAASVFDEDEEEGDERDEIDEEVL